MHLGKRVDHPGAVVYLQGCWDLIRAASVLRPVVLHRRKNMKQSGVMLTLRDHGVGLGWFGLMG